jgi:hypothetical protein
VPAHPKGFGLERWRSLLTLLSAGFFLCACSHRAPTIPNVVSEDEYSLYAAWIRHHFRHPPARLVIGSRTFVFDPLGTGQCKPRLLESLTHIDHTSLQALHDLGEASYTVHTDKFRQDPFRIPWKYEEAEGLGPNLVGRYSFVTFSRVAFNPDRKRAFFAFDDACGGLCGGGGPVYATRTSRGWTFDSQTGFICSWTY